MRHHKLNATIFISIAICLLCLLPISAWAAPGIAFDQTEFDFGRIIQGKAVTHVFEFHNTGNETLNIKSVKAG